jgi:dihydropteroate synthase
MSSATLQDSTPLDSNLSTDGAVLEDQRRPLVMGVVNITPDSFSDGGRWLQPDLAVARAEALMAEGADILDLGAESTRPGGGTYGRGAVFVPVEEELARLLPVLSALRRTLTIPISVDTRKADVARAALAAGADMINDISALGDPEMANVVASAGSPIVLMHSRGSLASMQKEIAFEDVVDEVAEELAVAAARAEALGIERKRILIDPGIGFGKTAAQNLQLLRGLDRLQVMGLPILVGASRKSFIGEVIDVGPEERLPGSLAAAAWAAHHRAAIVRVHDVAETVQFLEVWQAIETSRESTP